MRQMVIMPHVAGGLRREAWAEVCRQWPSAVGVQKQVGDDFAYADLLRYLWRLPGDLVIVEQDVIPPPTSIPRLLDCIEPWCTHPHWLGTHFKYDTLGLARFSWELRKAWPHLADDALARDDHRLFTRWGLTDVPADCSEVVLETRGRRACLKAGAKLPSGRYEGQTRPSTVTWVTCDTELNRELRNRGFTPHVHLPATTHLHVY